jgi:hypothetical protein
MAGHLGEIIERIGEHMITPDWSLVLLSDPSESIEDINMGHGKSANGRYLAIYDDEGCRIGVLPSGINVLVWNLIFGIALGSDLSYRYSGVEVSSEPEYRSLKICEPVRFESMSYDPSRLKDFGNLHQMVIVEERWPYWKLQDRRFRPIDQSINPIRLDGISDIPVSYFPFHPN